MKIIFDTQEAWAEVTAIPEVPTTFVPFVIGAGAGLVVYPYAD